MPFNGIILRADQQKQKVTILDSKQGKNVLLYTGYIPICSHIIYSVINKGGISRLIMQELWYVPLSVSVEGLTFLHQVAMLCDYAIPIGLSVPDVYDVVQWLCATVPLSSNTIPNKHIILMKLCTLFGVYTIQESVCACCLHLLHTIPIELLHSITFHVRCLEELELWIRDYLQESLAIPNIELYKK